MKSVEQRRQRLAAMREEAALQIDGGSLLSSPLASPFLPSSPLENVANLVNTVVAEGEVKSSGFGFYTDPLAGFSGSKRRRPGLAVPRTPSNPPQAGDAAPLLHPGIVSHPPSHLQPAVLYPPPAPPAWQPIPCQPPPPFVPGFTHPQSPSHHYTQPVPQYMNQLPNQAFGRGGRAGGRSSPSGPARGRGFGTGGTGYTPNGPRGGGRGYVGPSGRGGRGNSWGGRSPAGNSWGGGNRSAGRGQGGGRTVSAVEQPHLFFKKSMVEDPWQRLEASRGRSIS